MPGLPSAAAPRHERAVVTASVPAVSGRDAHPILDLVGRRAAIGIVTLFVVSAVVFLATQVLPGNAAFAVLGRGANPARLRATELQLHLNRGLFDQYWIWLSGLFTGKLGTSLANGEPVWALVKPRLINSARKFSGNARRNGELLDQPSVVRNLARRSLRSSAARTARTFALPKG